MDLFLRSVSLLVLIFGGPALALWARARWGRPAAWLGIGAFIFTGAQGVRLPLLAGLSWLFQRGWLPHPSDPLTFNLMVLSVSAGLFEETARWLGMRWARRRQERIGLDLGERDVLVLGLAHGGAEAFWLGLIGWIQLIAMTMIRESLLPTPPGAEAAVAAYWNAPAWLPLVGILERGMAIGIHIGLAFLVWLGVRRSQLALWGAAVLLHALVNGTAVYAMARWGVWAAEGVVALWALISAWGVKRIRARAADSR
ncbi:YhfC family glutamic-type intramembrane protease [Thermoflexus sp.]|uniref:YhfC family glutamic-type intramembrane protease n=1 Tax=Thermoflexus sp. TaxID=1969742 RepID=UPI0035E43218